MRERRRQNRQRQTHQNRVDPNSFFVLTNNDSDNDHRSERIALVQNIRSSSGEGFQNPNSSFPRPNYGSDSYSVTDDEFLRVAPRNPNLFGTNATTFRPFDVRGELELENRPNSTYENDSDTESENI